MKKLNLQELAGGVLHGEPLAVTRALSYVMEEKPDYGFLLKRLYSYSGRAVRIGLMGPTGCGKSSLASRIIGSCRLHEKKVGVLVVDPTRPLSDGAFFGDRIRMQQHALDPGVFIRSLSIRDPSGGFGFGIFGALHVLEASGCRVVLIETVGSGRDEAEVTRVSDTVIYVTVPSLVDDIQTIKSGIMEIGDIFVVNKADLGGKDSAIHCLQSALNLGEGSASPVGGPSLWKPPILATIATQGYGVTQLLEYIERHQEYLRESGEGRMRKRRQAQEELSLYMARRSSGSRKTLKKVSQDHLDMLLDGKTDPVTLGNRLLPGLQKRNQRYGKK